MSDKPKQPKHGLNNPKTRLSAPCPTARGKMSTLGWDIWNNNPRLVVDTKDPQLANPGSQYGRITAAMEPPTFFMFLQLLEEAATTAPNGWKREIKLYQGGRDMRPGDEPQHATSVWIGRDGEGVVFVSVVKVAQADGWPKIKFIPGAPDHRFAKVSDENGAEVPKTELSKQYALGYANMLRSMMGTLLITAYVEPEPFIPGNRGGGYGNRGGGGGGGYNRNNGGGGGNSGGSSSGDDFDGDSIPF